MRNEFLPFSRATIDNRDIGAVSKVLRSGWITTGSQCAAFERKFAQSIGCRRCRRLFRRYFPDQYVSLSTSIFSI